MTEELGKIEKPPVEEFKTGRKLCLVPLLFQARESQAEYLEKLDKYWKQVEEQIGNLESKLGKVKRIYHELVHISGENGLKVISDLNERGSQIIRKWLASGAELEAVEEAETLAEYMDWSRCLTVIFESKKVFAKVYESYQEASKKRNEFIASQVDKTLKADEIGILLITEGYRIQFPPDIQIFYVAPPALDEIERWIRDRRSEALAEEKPGANAGPSAEKSPT